MLGILGGLLPIIAPIAIRIIGWALDYMQAKDQTKKQYFLFVAAFEAERGVSVRLSKSARDQIERARQELLEGQKK